MENLVVNIGNPRKVELTVLSANGVKVELSRCTDVQLILWINGRSKRALSTQISNDVLIADLSASELSYLGEYSGQVKYTDGGVQQTTERVYLFRVANEFFKSTSGTGVSDTGSLIVSVSTPAAINKGYSAYELAVQNGYVGTEKEWIESLSKDSKDAASVALQSAKNADDKAKEAELAASNANNATVSVTAAKEAAVQAAVSANSAANSANTAKDAANTAAANANDKANLANTAANNADVSKTNAEKATADANTATLSAINAATNANAKAVYANEQGDYAKQQGLNAVATAGEASTNADNAAFAASQQAAYAKQQGDYAKQEAQGIDAKIATKAEQSDLVQLEQESNDLLNYTLSDTQSNNYFDKTRTLLQGYWSATKFNESAKSKSSYPIIVYPNIIYKYPFASTFGNNYTVTMVDANGARLSAFSGNYADGFITFSVQSVCYVSLNIGYIDAVDTFMLCNSAIYPSNYQPYLPQKKINTELILADDNNILRGKYASFNGDSICYGAGYVGGYGLIIAQRNNMRYQNIAVAGATIASNTFTSEDPSISRHWISKTINNMDINADYAIVEGFINDMWINVPLGAVTAGYEAILDDTTFCGSVESVCKQLIQRFSNKKYGFIIIHRGSTKLTDDNAYVVALKKCLLKWSIPTLNLLEIVPPFAMFDKTGDMNNIRQLYTYNGDGCHPNEQGYRIYYCDKIESWMRSL